ncbi:MAG: 50S ribosomal protein L29 [Planctomycetes bacterium]|nr:50S ribosomal protein L29 [Planctomycetota bacterium]
MSIDALRGQPEKELVGRVNQLAQENFKARFTTEAMTSQRGAEMLKRRREIARIKTVLSGRQKLEQAKAEEKKLSEAIKKLGAPHEGDTRQKNARRNLQNRLAQVQRTVRELGALAEK